MLVACGEKSYVSIIYYLLRRNPVLVEGSSRRIMIYKECMYAGAVAKTMEVSVVWLSVVCVL